MPVCIFDWQCLQSPSAAQLFELVFCWQVTGGSAKSDPFDATQFAVVCCSLQSVKLYESVLTLHVAVALVSICHGIAASSSEPAVRHT